MSGNTVNSSRQQTLRVLEKLFGRQDRVTTETLHFVEFLLGSSIAIMIVGFIISCLVDLPEFS